MRLTCLMVGVVVCLSGLVRAQEVEEHKTRIGIIDIDIAGGGEVFAATVHKEIHTSLGKMGAYDIHDQKGMTEALSNLEEEFPRYCREPRCACAVGSALQMERMLFGILDKGEKTFGLRFTMVDVVSRQVIEKVAIESEPGVTLAQIVDAAIQKLHGHEDVNFSSKTHTYYGPEVHHEKQLYISAGACVGLGLIWALVNAATLEGNAVVADYSLWSGKCSGIGTGADMIPFFGRPGALANSYTAASDDAYGVFFNPAGLAWASGAEASFGFQSRFGLLNNFAASFVNKATREIGFGQGFQYSGDREGLFSEVFFVSAVAYKFNELFSFLRPVSVGATIRIAGKRTGEGVGKNAVSGGAAGVALDIGLQAELTEKIRYGLLVKNIPSIMRWKNVSTDTAYIESDPVMLHMGGIFQANYETFLICDARLPVYEDQVWLFAGGVERIIFRVLRIRVGIQKEPYFNTPWQFTGGFGLNVNTSRLWGRYLILDGSYEYNTLSMLSNVLNFSFRLGF